jgi:para-aminobenzoate synthetase/4-amino-4-deoxychorismate lyase
MAPASAPLLQKLVLRDASSGEWLVFGSPEDVCLARDRAEVAGAVSRACRLVEDEQLYAAGFVCYEASAAFDPALVTHPGGPLPLVCLGLFRAPERLDRLPDAGTPGPRHAWAFVGTRQEYLAAIAAIKVEIAAGNTYQVNYTVRQRADGIQDAWDLFLTTASDAPYAAYIECGDHAIVSASPELFFELDGDKLRCRPMKGTAARGMTTAEDREKRRALHESAKDRAENVMIADMVRNDLGRIAVPGTVAAEALYAIEKYRTVWQMTSTVSASTRASVADIFCALFPSASVTGAPKVASMKLIAALEDSPRQVYTGAIGYIAPHRRARFSVAIRTAVVDRKTRTGVYGVGGGIVWDSDAEDEYQECLNKARVLGTSVPEKDFSLLETMLWSSGDGFALLPEHLERLEGSAEYFDFSFDRVAIEMRLAAVGDTLSPAAKHRVRLLLRRNGSVEIETQPAPPVGEDHHLRLALATSPVNTRDPFLYHKTTRREVYEQALAAADDCDDVLLWNEEGNLTESSIGNVVLRLGRALWTPPVSCGLLAGTFRRQLLRENAIRERTLGVHELADAEAIYLINSVRGWMPCELVNSTGVGRQRLRK